MLLTASFALAGALNVVDTCRWNRPGTDRFTGDVVAAVDHYADIPPAIRDRLKARLAEHRYDDMVTISRDAIKGQQAYEPGITGMHFGENRVCREVTRQRWHPERQMKGLVYCEEGYCLMVPTVCGNLSRIQRLRSEEPLDIEPGAGPMSEPPAEPATPVAGALPLDLADLPPTAAGPPEQLAPPVLALPWQSPPAFPPYVWTGPLVRPLYPPGIPAVPEPAQWVQILSGVAVLTAWARRRRACRPQTL